MSSRTRLTLHPNEDWPGIIDRLLRSGADAEQKTARETMWVQVDHYVVYRAKLPIGPLNEDEDTRRDIAVRLLRRLEKDRFRHVREWRERQRRREAHASWWGWIRMMASSLGIDFARGSRQNIAPRGKPFQWARVVPVDPHVLPTMLGDPLGRSLDFLRRSSPDDLVAYLAELQDALNADARPVDAPQPGWPAQDVPPAKNR